MVTEQNKQGIAAYNFKQYSFKISFLGVVHFRGSPFGESMDWGSVFCPSPNFYNRPFYSCVVSYLAMNASEAGGDLVLIQTSLLFSCKCQVVSIRTT